ncbi:MAG TPA: hypothetical protein H9836_02040, partial [Candidatus Nocardiopsis merdipullorum]|nr:hypothetical protein [Candidatus Nocardiopsis merdipullorum]
MKEIVLDSGFLIALERRNPRAYEVQELLYRAGAVAHVPTGVVAQVWRDDPRQQILARLLKARHSSRTRWTCEQHGGLERSWPGAVREMSSTAMWP